MKILKWYKLITLIFYTPILTILLIELIFWGLIKQDTILLFWEDWVIVFVMLYISVTSILFSINWKAFRLNRRKLAQILDISIHHDRQKEKKLRRFLLLNTLICGLAIIIYNILNLIQVPIYSFTFYEARYFINPFLIIFGFTQIHYAVVVNRKYEYYI